MMIKRLAALIALLAVLLPAAAPAEIILWEDENGQVLLDDEGAIDFVPAAQPDQTAQPSYTPVPQATFAATNTPAAPAPVPAAETAPPSIPDETLQYGSSGSHVLAAQEKLTELGYYHGKCSGNFLEGTQSAARRFQKLNNLPETGKIDAATWIVLFSSAAIARDGSTPYATPSPIPEITPTPTPAPFTYTRKLEYGMQNDLVAALQTRLSELGFYEAKVFKLQR